MRRTTIKPHRLHKLAQKFVRSNPMPRQNIANGGRPKAFSDAMILTIMSIQRLGQFSFRETLKYCGDFFPEVPSLSSYHERIEIFPKRLFKKFFAHLGT